MAQPGKSSWWRRRSDAPVSTRVCPACHTAGPARLYDGQRCAACEAQQAWSQIGDARLVIDRASIDLALRRRAGAAIGEPRWRRRLAWLAPATTLVLASLAGWHLVRLFSARSIGPLDALLADLVASHRWAMLAGLGALIAGVVAVLRLRRRREFRRIPILASHLVAIIVGCSALFMGCVHRFALHDGFAGRFTSMPARGSLGDSASVERIVNATVVVLAPDADGDASNPAIGAGAIIAADDRRAWIVTCSHVAMPYAAVAAWRDARTARPVWVQLSDGREGRATVRWTAPPPLDVVLVELPIANPPEPVAIAADTATVQVPASVSFVPNPYRAGWLVQRGELLRRETHRTPAGVYDLLYTDLPVTFGDSGSGLYDARGLLIGLNTWTRIRGDGPSQGISLPTETMRVLVDAIHQGTLDALGARGPLGSSLPPASARSPGT